MFQIKAAWKKRFSGCCSRCRMGAGRFRLRERRPFFSSVFYILPAFYIRLSSIS
ncbi:hypothetical protein CLOM621_09043 [Clostridium sp. M62/1]|nr:hypothetical protein CLOM621_09043 [Clostridium sp. M62/1]